MTENVVEVQDLTRRFGAKTALDNVSLSVRRGIVFGLVGENGAGKTTFIKHLLGLFRAKSGSVRVFGLDPVREPVSTLGRIGYLSEDRDLPDWMRVHELLNYTQAFFPKWDETYARELVETFALDPRQKIKTLSRGQRAQTGLLVALAHRPDLLLLDEPSSGLDPVVRRDILGAIIRTVADEGRTVFFSSHLLEEVERVADDVGMIHAGRLVLNAPLDQIKASHHRLTLRFQTSQAAPPRLPGILFREGAGLEWTVLCDGSLDALRVVAEKLGARIVEEGTPTLEEIFVARLKQTASARKEA